MTYLLDTNACISHMNVRNSPVAARLRAHQPSDIVTCSVVRAELIYGALRAANPVRSLAVVSQFLHPFASLPFDDPAADVYGRIRADLAARGSLIGPNDLLIAAIAVASHCTLVTHNTREFSRVRGLLLEDWEAIP